MNNTNDGLDWWRMAGYHAAFNGFPSIIAWCESEGITPTAAQRQAMMEGWESKNPSPIWFIARKPEGVTTKSQLEFEYEKLIARYRELLAVSTPGKWSEQIDGDGEISIVGHDLRKVRQVAYIGNMEGTDKMDHANITYITELHNTIVPELIRLIEAWSKA